MIDSQRASFLERVECNVFTFLTAPGVHKIRKRDIVSTRECYSII